MFLRAWLRSVIRGGVVPLQAASQALLIARGRDATNISSTRSCLVLAPHPDDETLGCGVTIIRKRVVGTHVKVVIVTDGKLSAQSNVFSSEGLAAMRRTEALEACDRLGVDQTDVMFLGYPDGEVGRYSSELSAKIEEVVKATGADEILAPWIHDYHPDHRLLSAVVRRLAAEGRLATPVLEYPIWSWQAWPWSARPSDLLHASKRCLRHPIKPLTEGRPILIRMDGYREAKKYALDAYRSQLVNLTGEPGWRTLPPEIKSYFLGS